MQRIPTLVIMLFATLALSDPRSADAQPRDEIREAKQLAQTGAEHYQATRYQEAAEAFKAAYELSRRPELLFNVGQSYRLAGKLAQAEAYLQQYLADMPNAPNADEVVNAIVEIQQQIAADLATLQVETTVPGRLVFVDDDTEPRCTTPCAVTMPSGSRRLVVRGDGAVDHVEQLTLEPGETRQVRVTLAALVARGNLLVVTDRPAGTLEVGGSTVSLPLPGPLELEAGEYDVSIRAARNASWTGRVIVAPDTTTDIFVPMQSLVDARRRGSVRKSIAHGLVGVSLAAMGGGSLLGLQAKRTYRALESGDLAGADVADQGRSQQLGANVLFASAGTALLTAVGLYIWDAMASEKDPTPD